jgi:hypothetical protein
VASPFTASSVTVAVRVADVVKVRTTFASVPMLAVVSDRVPLRIVVVIGTSSADAGLAKRNNATIEMGPNQRRRARIRITFYLSAR